jgi:hypothetical protein
MDAYFDSAIIVKLYVQEATSPDAFRLVGAYAAPYVLTQWHKGAAIAWVILGVDAPLSTVGVCRHAAQAPRPVSRGNLAPPFAEATAGQAS